MAKIDGLTSDKLKELNLDELVKLKSELDKTIDDVKKTHKQAFINKVREDAAKNGMSLDELIEAIKPSKEIKSSIKKPAKYKHPDDSTKTWSGIGPKPKWLKELLKDDKTLDDFKV